MPDHFEQRQMFPSYFRIFSCLLIVFLLSAVALENVTQTGELSNVTDELKVPNNVTDELENDTAGKMRAPPVLEVFHGKMNSVAHDLLAGIEKIPPLSTEEFVKKPEKGLLLDSQVNHPSSDFTIHEDNVTGVEQFMEQTSTENLPVIDNGTLNNSDALILNDTQLFPDLPKMSNISIEADNHMVTSPALTPPSQMQTPLVVSSKENESEPSHDDIPSFSEWANKKMAEVERNKGENLTVATTKLRLKNYASPDCGAKVIAANPEATSPSAILSPSRDDYMLNPCNIKIWFAVELCESIQPQRIEIANFELFSSSPHNLSFWVSDRFPTRDWTQVAIVEAKDERNVQSFPLPRLTHFAKYVKVELHSHYGSEHYCPISLFKAYGTSELEVLDSSDSDGSDGDDGEDGRVPMAEENDSSSFKITGPLKKEGETKDDLFHSAKAAVMSIVQKAAQVLGNGGSRNNSCSNITASSECLTPGYQIVCTNCYDRFYFRVYDILCCNGHKIKTLLEHNFVHSVIANTPYCSAFGLNLTTNVTTTGASYSIGVSYLKALFGEETLAALCNYLAIAQKTSFLNDFKVRITANESVNQPTAGSGTQEPALNELNVPALLEEGQELTVDSSSVSNQIPLTKNPLIEPTLPKVHDKESPTVASIIPPNENSVTLEEPEVNATAPIPSPAKSIDSQPLPDPPEGIVEVESPVSSPAPEPVNQPLPMTDESLNADSIALDSLLSELEEDTPQQETTKPSAVNNSPPIQKESVFVRLANRIKVLEVNMSLSSQYLEELSRRYKKQVEELQRTLAGLIEERRLAAKREAAQEAQIVALTQKMEALTTAVTQLLEERNQWLPKAYFFAQNNIIILAEVIVVFVILGFCRWLVGQNKAVDGERVYVPIPERRRSLDSPFSIAETSPKVRRPSEEALIPSSSTHQELLINGAKRKTSKEGKHKRKRKRKEKLDDGLSIVSAEGEGWILPNPEFMQTAQRSRSQRMSIHTQTSSSQETLGSSIQQPPSGQHSGLKKKTVALRKFVKKLF